MMMKQYLVSILLIIGLGVSAPSWSMIIGGEEVGSLDNLIGATGDLNSLGDCGPGSSPEAEECWAENVLGGGVDLNLSGKDEDVAVMYSDDMNIAAFELNTGPGYFIVKNAKAWVLLENLSAFDWGVLKS